MSDRFRNTVQRTEVLDVVLASEGHLTAGEIFERVRRQDPKIAYGTVYRALHLLAERVIPAQSASSVWLMPFRSRVARINWPRVVG